MKRKENGRYVLICCCDPEQKSDAQSISQKLTENGYRAVLLEKAKKLTKYAEQEQCVMVILLGRPDGMEKKLAHIVSQNCVYLMERNEDGSVRMSMLIVDRGEIKQFPVSGSLALDELAVKRMGTEQKHEPTRSEQKRDNEKRQRRIMWIGLLLAALYGIFITVREFFF